MNFHKFLQLPATLCLLFSFSSILCSHLGQPLHLSLIPITSCPLSFFSFGRNKENGPKQIYISAGNFALLVWLNIVERG